MPLESEKLREVLVGTSVDEDVFERAVAESEAKRRPLVIVLSEAGLIGDDRTAKAVAKAIGHPFVRLSRQQVPDHVLRILPERLARRTGAVVFAAGGGVVDIAMADPDDLATVQLIEKKTGWRGNAHFAMQHDLQAAMGRYRDGLEGEIAKLFAHASIATDGEAAVAAVRAILTYARRTGASEIMIEPCEDGAMIRCLIDGRTYDAAFLSVVAANGIVTHVRAAADVRTSGPDGDREEGRLRETVEGERLCTHVSVTQDGAGQRVLLRLMSEKDKHLGIGNLGFSNRGLQALARQAQKSFGAMLFAGPAECGKTTTAYAVVGLYDANDVNIVTVEESTECSLAGLRQVDVSASGGETVASCLRDVVKQDPDVIMVGELVESKSVGIALQAAKTGHVLISSVLANDAAGALVRLREMGVDSSLVASSVNGIIAQRLVRRVCANCATSVPANRDELLSRGLSDAFVRRLFSSSSNGAVPRLQRGNGCDRCGYTGYLGRVGIFEVLEMDDAMRALITQNPDARAIVRQAVRSGMSTMVEDGICKVVAGVTTIDEILRAVG